jgi:5'-3' exoribonuclease 1
MGIPYYFYTLTKTYNNIISNKLPSTVDIYCMDFNGVIHPICAKIIAESTTIDEENIIKQLYSKVLDDIAQLKPKKVLICVDGLVPMAKITQQRKRRYLSVYKNKIDNITPKWDTNAITPGTKFMQQLNTYFKKQIRYNTTNTIISFTGSDEYGEGEHKIFKLLDLENHSTVLINGLDADLIILSLMSHRPNIYLMRENEGIMYVSIDNLRKAIVEELIHKWNITNRNIYLDDIFSQDSKNLIESYCVMCSLLGNDFIPHILTLNLKHNGLEKLMYQTGLSYQTYGLLVQNNTINYSILTDILQNIAKTEDKDIFQITEKYIKTNTAQNTLNSEYYAVKHKDPIASKIYADISKWRQTYYKYLFNTNTSIDSSVITNACYNYIKGIYWTYNYYKKQPYDALWYYPYTYPPSLKNIADYALGNAVPIIKETKLDINSQIQLMIVLPKESKNLLDTKYQKYMEDLSLGLYHLYPSSYKIYTYLKTHLWECVPELPTINLDIIIKHIK